MIPLINTYLGRHRQGEVITLPLLCTDSDRAPVSPSSHPVVYVYNEAGTKLLSGRMAVADRYQATGWFSHRLTLGGDFDPGHYRVIYHYGAASAAYAKSAHFEVVAGHEDGPVIAMTHYRRPHAAFLVHQAEDGTRVLGRNPSV
jgi:hypothetical protein